MSVPYAGEVRLVGFDFAPVDWAICNGQEMPISENETLFTLLGTTYGGDGQTYFNLPDLQGRIPIHLGSNGVSTYVLGQTGGIETETLLIGQYPNHNHALLASTDTTGGSNSPANNVTIGSIVKAYSTDEPETAINSAMVGSSGGNAPHNNLQPYVVLNWVIAIFGVYPTQN